MADTRLDSSDLVARAKAWSAGDPDPETRAELEQLIERGETDALAARMGPELDFGTAGLRGPVGAGPARMNRAVVMRAVRAFGEYLLARVPDARALPVIVGFDGRLSSRALSEAAVSVLLAMGFDVRYFEEPAPTPLVAYAARVLSAAGALIVTASHNPREDNGLKVYGPDARQLVFPDDVDVARRRESVGVASAIAARSLSSLSRKSLALPPDLFGGYLAELFARLPARAGSPQLSIAYTPLHGLGREPVERALRARGFDAIHVVAEQAEPDGAFPTAPSPNPELPQTLARVLALAETVQAELVLVNDPDVDRLAAAAPLPSGRYHVFSGNELAVLLADFVLSQAEASPQPLLVSSLVSTPLLGHVARAYGARFERTLTGFKWIWSAARALEASGGVRFVFGCEEALGYSIGQLVRDKDGISAAVWLAELAERVRREGKTLVDRLHELYREHGAWGSAQRSLELRDTSPAAFRALVAELCESPPPWLGGEPLGSRTDYRSDAAQRPVWVGRADLLELEYGSSRVLVRPSGTEPKLKIYADHCEPLVRAEAPEAAAQRARARCESLAAELLGFITGRLG